jgi:CheY-like chemotaxis protein
MSRRVLLIDSDVDKLGALASALRARGLTVANASEPFDALELAFQIRPEVVLLARSLDLDGELTTAFSAVPELADTPLLRLVDAGELETIGANEVLRADVDHIISRITHASPRESALPLVQDIRGNLEQMPLPDLLQLLAMNRRSGSLGITTASGAGEVRLADGEVVDAAFRRLDGDKALFRLMGERDGRFAFVPGESTAPRRIQSSTSMLMMEAMRQVDELARRRTELAPGGDALLIDDPPGSVYPQGVIGDEGRVPTPAEESVARELTVLLQIPRSIDELLDEIPAPDLFILDLLARLTNAGRVRRIPRAALTTPIAPPEQLPVLRSLVGRLTHPGFTPPPRLIIAASAKRMLALAHAVRRITDASVPTDAPPRAAVPRLLGTLRLGDGVELALVGLPTEETLAPAWSLALPGAAAVVRLDEAGGKTLEAHCEAVEVMLIEAESLMGALDVAVPGQVAALVRSALEMAAGV